jgi:hypothetical protein
VVTPVANVIALTCPARRISASRRSDDVLRIRAPGAMSIVAHPTSLKNDMRWHEATRPFDGIEWLNGDSEWRDEGPLSLARILLTY